MSKRITVTCDRCKKVLVDGNTTLPYADVMADAGNVWVNKTATWCLEHITSNPSPIVDIVKAVGIEHIDYLTITIIKPPQQ